MHFCACGDDRFPCAALLDHCTKIQVSYMLVLSVRVSVNVLIARLSYLLHPVNVYVENIIVYS